MPSGATLFSRVPIAQVNNRGTPMTAAVSSAMPKRWVFMELVVTFSNTNNSGSSTNGSGVHTPSMLFENRRGVRETADTAQQLDINKLVWLTAREAAQYLRTSLGAVHNMVYRGQIPRYKVRRRLLFKRCDLDLHVEVSRKGGFK